MTYREMYTAIVNGEITEEVVAMAQNAIAKLDERNAKRASYQSETAKLNAPIKDEIVAWLTENGTHVAKEIGEALHLTTAKASALCGQLVKEERVSAEEIKVPKVGKRIAYTVR